MIIVDVLKFVIFGISSMLAQILLLKSLLKFDHYKSINKPKPLTVSCLFCINYFLSMQLQFCKMRYILQIQTLLVLPS